MDIIINIPSVQNSIGNILNALQNKINALLVLCNGAKAQPVAIICLDFSFSKMSWFGWQMINGHLTDLKFLDYKHALTPNP